MLLDLFLVHRVDRDVCGSKCFLVQTYELINTNSWSFYSTKRKIETKFEESILFHKNERSSNRSRIKIKSLDMSEKKTNSSNFKQDGNRNPCGAKWVWKEIFFRIGGGGPTLVLLVAGCVNNDGHTGLLAFLHRIVIYRRGKISRDSVKIEEKYRGCINKSL